MTDEIRNESLARLELLASALAGRGLRVEHADPGTPAWTNGSVIFLDGAASSQAQLEMLCVQASLLAAGSLNHEVMKWLVGRPQLVQRYLSVEGPRALSALESVLPPLMRVLTGRPMAFRPASPANSLVIAQGNEPLADPPAAFGTIRPRELLRAQPSTSSPASNGQHVPRRQPQQPLTQLADDANDGEDAKDFATSPVGGGGGLGKLLQKMFQMVRRLKSGGSPGADAPTHWTRSGPRAGALALRTSAAAAETVEGAFGKGRGILYPEWDVHQQCYRTDWCRVEEVDPPAEKHASVVWLEGHGLRKPLARLGMGLDRFHRQAQGDDIDIDAAIEMQVHLAAGSAAEESVYVESQRHRRDLSVLVLLDMSGSVAQPGPSGATVHEQQRSVAAALTTVLYEIGDRVALYAFHSQGRSSVHLVPVKRFDEGLDNRIMSRLHSLIPGAYSRLGAAIRHAATTLIERSGTSRKLLVVLSDGLAYDHGYEPIYGAADTRQALHEARRDGVACLCLSVGAGTEAEVLRRVFGSAAYATVPRPHQLGQVIGPLFRSALRAAQGRRRVA